MWGDHGFPKLLTEAKKIKERNTHFPAQTQVLTVDFQTFYIF